MDDGFLFFQGYCRYGGGSLLMCVFFNIIPIVSQYPAHANSVVNLGLYGRSVLCFRCCDISISGRIFCRNFGRPLIASRTSKHCISFHSHSLLDHLNFILKTNPFNHLPIVWHFPIWQHPIYPKSSIGMDQSTTSFPKTPDDFEDDPRVSYSKLDQKWILETDDGTEFEYDQALKRWIPSVRAPSSSSPPIHLLAAPDARR